MADEHEKAEQNAPKKPAEILSALRERTKELNCLYEVESLLARRDLSTAQILAEVVRVLPQGWQYPDICQAEILLGEASYRSSDFSQTDQPPLLPALGVGEGGTVLSFTPQPPLLLAGGQLDRYSLGGKR